jgi:hypothetical protein
MSVINWKWINAAYPFEHSFQEKRNTIAVISLFTSILIFLLQPFGMITMGMGQLSHFVGYLFISLSVLTINYFGFPFFFPAYFEDDRWSVVKAFLFLVYNFLIIGFWNHIFISLYNNDISGMVSVWELSRWIFQTLAIGVISSGFLILLRFNILSRKYLQISQDLNEQLHLQLKPQKTKDEYNHITIELENKPITIRKNDLKYISAEGNYVGIHYNQDGIFNKKLFRNTISQVENSLSRYPQFFRCHRSYLINLDVIEGTQGNSQGLFVKLDNGAVKIPVARSKIRILKEQLDKEPFI